MWKKQFKSHFLLLFFFLIGVVFRLWFISLVPQPFGYDQSEYNSFAWAMMHNGLTVWQPRLYGYPLVLVVIYTLFGWGNEMMVQVVQATFDSLAAVFLFLLAKKLFKKESVAWIVYLAYLFNLFTSAYVGLFLSEITTIFLITLIYFLLYGFLEKKDLKRFFILGLLLGFLPQVRPAFIFFTVAIVLVLIFIAVRSKLIRRKLWSVSLFIILYFIPFLYNIVGNLRTFNQFSLTTVDNLFAREFYVSLYVSGRAPIHAKDPSVFPVEVQQIYNEFTPKPKNKQERQAMAEKYLKLGWEKVSQDPAGYVISRIKKFWYVWEKHYIFYYEEPKSPTRDLFVYWGNVGLIITAVFGLIIWMKKVAGRSSSNTWFAVLTVFLFAYISCVHSISLTEERFSLPGYPLLFLFAAFTISYLWERLSKRQV